MIADSGAIIAESGATTAHPPTVPPADAGKTPRSRPGGRLVALAGMLVLAACGASPQLERRIEGACETMKCACVQPNNNFFADDVSRPVKFRPNGSAYCDPGQILTVTEQNSPFFTDPIPPNYYQAGGSTVSAPSLSQGAAVPFQVPPTPPPIYETQMPLNPSSQPSAPPSDN